MTKTSKLNKASKTNTFLGLNLVPRLIPTLILGSTLSFVLSFLFSLTLSPTSYAAPTTFTVTNTNDSGAGSLRQAIEDANSNGNPGDQDVIEFDIAGFGDKLIEPQSTLTITQSVLIDGYTQGDAEENTQPWPEAMDGVIRVGINAMDGNIEVQSDNVTIKGIAITGSISHQIIITDSDSFVLTGSYLGITQTGFDHFWGSGIGDFGGGISITSSDNVEIGGTSPADRNVIGRCNDACIGIHGTSGNSSDNVLVAGNNIGIAIDNVAPITANGFDPSITGGIGIEVHRYTSNVKIGDSASSVGNYLAYNTKGSIYAKDTSSLTIAANWIINNWTGTGSPPWGAGVVLEGVSTATIGGNTSNKGNIIAGNESGSLVIRNSADTSEASRDISIMHNKFGVMNDGTTAFPNEVDAGAVYVGEDSHDMIIRNNTIHNTVYTQWASSGANGIRIEGSSQRIAVLQNSIYNNAGLGIDIHGNYNAHDANDAGDVDSGPNGLLNSPGYTQIVEDGGNTELTFTADLQAGDYRIEFFSNTVADPSGYGEGETYLGYVNITHDGNGLQAFSHTLSGTGHTNLALTATEIDPDSFSGFGATSEFGAEGDLPTPPPQKSDLSLKKVILNPEDYSNGNILDYQFTVRNNGPDPVDISVLSSTIPLTPDNLVLDILPPNLTYSGVTGDVSCVYYGDGSASMFGSMLGNHSTYGAAACGYSGVDPHTLNSGDTFTFTLHAEVTDDSPSSFTNFALASFVWGIDEDMQTVVDAIENNEDIVDAMINRPTNNLGIAPLDQADAMSTIAITDAQNVVPGGQIGYTLTTTNNGPGVINPTDFNMGGMNPMMTSIFLVLLPPNLTYLTQSNPDVVCVDAGVVSLLGGSGFVDYPNHHGIMCGYFGSNTSLTPGQSISTTLTATVDSMPTSFTTSILSGGGVKDPDMYLIQAIGYQGKAIVSTAIEQGINNVSTVTYNTNTFDQDSDGIPDQVEDSLAPNGDGNGDGIRDKLQSDVASAPNSVTGAYTTLAVTGDCNTVTNFAVAPESSQSILDTQYNYPLGLKDFSLDCTTPGGSANATIYYDKVYSQDSYQVRKLMDSTYSDLVDATIGTATVNGNQVTTITYSLTDGGAIDADKATNSSITDPVGPGVLASTGSSIGDGIGNLVNTGVGIYGIIVAVLALLAGSSALIYRSKQRGVR